MRQCSTQYLLWKTHNSREQDGIEAEHSGFPGIHELYEEATQEPHSFLNLDFRNRRALLRFEKVMWSHADHFKSD